MIRNAADSCQRAKLPGLLLLPMRPNHNPPCLKIAFASFIAKPGEAVPGDILLTLFARQTIYKITNWLSPM
jgi:hypothetical protein